MVLPGAGRSLSCFEHHVPLTMPDIARIAAIPRANVARSHAVPEPFLYELSTVGEFAGTHGGAGAAAPRCSGKAHNVLVVGATDVSAGSGHLREIDAVGRRLNPARFWVAALECRFPRHDWEQLYWDMHRAAWSCVRGQP